MAILCTQYLFLRIRLYSSTISCNTLLVVTNIV
nr:MAG TPA: hypothetical protein [Caudoviricetes sp.]